MKRLILVLLTGAALAVSSPAYAAVKTIVLVHGAFADGSGWKPVADILQSHGYSVLVVQEPETSFAADVAATRRDRVTVALENVCHRLPSGTIGEGAVDQNDNLDGRVCRG